MSWQQDISAKIGELEATPVIRFDIDQELTEAQKKQAQANVSKSVTVSLISDDNYSVTVF